MDPAADLVPDQVVVEQVPPAVQEFLSFIKSKEGQESVVKAGFYPLPSDQVEKISVAVGTLATSGTMSKQ